MGGSFEVDSINHIKKLIFDYKVSPQDILYSLPVKKTNDIKLATSLGVDFFIIDSLAEYYKVSRNSRNKVRYILRLNIVDFIDAEIPAENQKWGSELSKVKDIIKTIHNNNDNFCGISFYVPQEYSSREVILNSIEKIKENFNDYHFDYIDIGGGIDAESSVIYATLLNEYFGTSQLIIEPGRFLLDPCIDFECKINAVYEKYGNKFIVLNTSIYAGFIDVAMKGKRFAIEDEYCLNLNCNKAQVYVCGLTSDNIDFFGVYNLYEGIKVGDKIKIKNCGAYSNVMHTQFYKIVRPKYRLKMEL